ncbi:MAG: ion transporter [Gammaproteobacteria bacterium]|nr:ion transporter [Gammaproteobacteria bacterium]MCP5424881.1 ion transporter [Gammaproteobacteria bacterium]MCP5458142.1 ion transporter [Gammaproteobacteria bacterium]
MRPPHSPTTSESQLSPEAPGENRSAWRRRLHEIIFEADTPAGKLFDVLLIALIVLSVIVVFLESVPDLRERNALAFRIVEWLLTLLFSAEYALRLVCVGHPWRYAVSFYGIVDLLAILPTYLSLLVPGMQSLMVIRALRLLRVFRVFKMARYLREGRVLATAIWSTRRKIIVFLLTVLTLVTIIGALMYLIEGEKNGFDSIPRGMYWAIVTLTTVGYGDISPHTWVGQLFASLVMIMGYGIIAVPTGIVTVALSRAGEQPISTQVCPACAAEGHDADARYCKYCGAGL